MLTNRWLRTISRARTNNARADTDGISNLGKQICRTAASQPTTNRCPSLAAGTINKRAAIPKFRRGAERTIRGRGRFLCRCHVKRRRSVTVDVGAARHSTVTFISVCLRAAESRLLGGRARSGGGCRGGLEVGLAGRVQLRLGTSVRGYT